MANCIPADIPALVNAPIPAPIKIGAAVPPDATVITAIAATATAAIATIPTPLQNDSQFSSFIRSNVIVCVRMCANRVRIFYNVSSMNL